MSKQTETLHDRAHRIARSAERLARLVDVGAPDFVIERERQLLFKFLSRFPVDLRVVAMIEDIERQEFLDSLQQETGVDLKQEPGHDLGS